MLMTSECTQFTLDEVARYFAARVPALRQTLAEEWRGPCPIHRGEGDSFAVKAAEGTWFCHSQCGRGGDIISLEMEMSGAEFREALSGVSGIVGREATGPTAKSFKSDWQDVERYQYTDEDGRLLYEVVRKERGTGPAREKKFVQCTPDGSGGVVWKLNGIRRVPYRLDKILGAETVCLVEGEKDVHTLESWGLTASCNPGGSGGSRLYAQWLDIFRGRHVVIAPDNDDAGHRHAATVSEILLPVAESIRIVELPDVPHKGDVSDWRASGGTAEQFFALVNDVPALSTEGLEKLRGRWGIQPLGEPAQSLPPVRMQSSTGQQSPHLEPWPELAPQALYGLAGDVVRAIEPHSEADPVALLGHLLVTFGNMVGRGPHFRVGGACHYTNLNIIHVGATASRKGTAQADTFFVIRTLDQEWMEKRVQSGLSTGEGLIWGVRDPIFEDQPIKEKGRVVGYETVKTDTGISDKRLLLIEPEFGSTLRVLERDGNTLSATIRQAWDSGNLRILTKNKAASATGAHISIIGHVTRDELLKYLTQTEQANGFANRFLWLKVKRSKFLPDGGQLDSVNLSKITGELARSCAFARTVGLMERTPKAREVWHAVYPHLSADRPGMFGGVTSRAEAQTMRLACLYALLDQSDEVRPEHLNAALALWQFAEESARQIFGGSVGDSTADELYRALQSRSAQGMTRTEMNSHFGRNKSSAEIARSLSVLADQGRVRSEHDCGEGGRPTERWFAEHQNTNLTKLTNKGPGEAHPRTLSSLNSFISYTGEEPAND